MWSGSIVSEIVGNTVAAYGTKEAAFRFRGIDFTFALSQGLFSSADIDTGSRFLLKVLSRRWDTCLREGRSLPLTVLDAGCGTGVLGICAAKALAAVPVTGLKVRAQDRDELARAFTEYNAAGNMVPADLRSGAVLSAHTEPLLAGPPDGRWDLILSNIPAKTGEKVLLDFISRSAGLLSAGGSVMVVVVNPLADLLRSRIRELALPLPHDERGKEHTVLVYGRPEKPAGIPIAAPENNPADFLRHWPCYVRRSGDFALEDTGYHLDAFHGVAGFDNPGGAVRAAARLICHMGPPLIARTMAKPVLVHEPDQGHFPVWFLRYRESAGQPAPGSLVLSGRNILALLASRHNLHSAAQVVPAVDVLLSRDALLAAAGKPYGAVFLFPGLVTGRQGAYWEGLGALLEPGGLAVIALPSTEAERFDRGKPRGFVRLGARKGDHKRHGFRALGYEKR
jgi:SAM-dependent methyltransferase